MSYERPNIRAMSGYTWGEQPQDTATIKLNTNENPYPPSPEVDRAIRELSGADLRRYPQPTADPLRDLIAQHHNLERDNVVVTNGGDEALRLAITTFVDPRQTFAMAEPSYSLYPVLAAIQDAAMAKIQLESDFSLPADFSTQANAQAAALTCLVNPHAPSGNLLSVAELDALAERIDGVLLIDEAYADFIDPDLDHTTAALIKRHANVLILRTFSKGYSLAGLRLGYLLGDPSLITPIVTKTRDSYNIDHISQQLGFAAFRDQAYAQTTWSRVRAERARVANDLGQLGLTSPESHANFILVTIPDDAKRSAPELLALLKENGILVRHFAQSGLDNKLRISVGTEEENNRLLEVMHSALF